METNKSLISIAGEVARLETMLLESEGMVTPEIEALLSVKEVNLPAKVDGYSLIMDRMALLETHYKERAKMFTQAAKSFGNAQESLKERLKIAMKEMGVAELSGNDIRGCQFS